MLNERMEPNVLENIRDNISLNDFIFLKYLNYGTCQEYYDLPSAGKIPICGIVVIHSYFILPINDLYNMYYEYIIAIISF